MGSRPGNPESDRPSLGEDDPGDVRKLAAYLVDHRCGRFMVRRAASLIFFGEGFDTCSRSPEKLPRPTVEQALKRIVGFVPSSGDFSVARKIRCGPRAERSYQAKCVANAREARNRLSIRLRLLLRLGKEVKHCPGVSGQG